MTKYALIGRRASRFGVVFFTDIQGTVMELNIHRGNNTVGAGNFGLRSTGSKLPGGRKSRFPEV